LIGDFADIRSNRPAAKRHVQDNLFWPLQAAFIALTPPR
jgi:hypothetical protein